jgi:hypothetical protein
VPAEQDDEPEEQRPGGQHHTRAGQAILKPIEACLGHGRILGNREGSGGSAPPSSIAWQVLGDFGATAEAPGLYAYITSHPEGRPAGVSDRIYWSIKRLGYRPTFAVEHILISHEPEIEETETLLVFKTIYVNHYLAARIQVGGLIDGEKAFGVAGSYAIMIDRMVFDGELSGFKRKLLGKRLEMDLDKRLRFVRSLARKEAR